MSQIGQNAYIGISTMTSDKNVTILNEAIASVLKQKRSYLTPKRFETIKKAALIAKEKKDINRYSDISDILYPDTKELMDRLESLSLEEVLTVADQVDPDEFLINTDKELIWHPPPP